MVGGGRGSKKWQNFNATAYNSFLKCFTKNFIDTSRCMLYCCCIENFIVSGGVLLICNSTHTGSEIVAYTVNGLNSYITLDRDPSMIKTYKLFILDAILDYRVEQILDMFA